MASIPHKKTPAGANGGRRMGDNNNDLRSHSSTARFVRQQFVIWLAQAKRQSQVDANITRRATHARLAAWFASEIARIDAGGGRR